MSSQFSSQRAELTSFIGRRRELADIKRSMSLSRLVTLTGVGGVGKTRLAMRVSHEVRRTFDDGVTVVELAEVGEPDLIGHALAQALNVRPNSAADLEDALIEHLSGKHQLLVLDNCEHLLEASGRLVALLLSATDRVHILATSREPLGVLGEHSWPVPPLSMPDLANVAPARGGYSYGHEAVQLFEERAAAVIPGFTLDGPSKRVAAQLCQRLDGLPLAIELAAVRIRALPIEEILARLENTYKLLKTGNRGGPARHQTLRATVDWSFDLCSPAEQSLWTRLSVFVGSFDLAAVESICADDDIPQADVLDVLSGLIDKSVVIREGTGSRARYRMLETIRTYGRERLVERGDEPTMRRRHRDHYLRLAQESENAWFGADQVDWRNLLQSEQANLWAALDYCLTVPDESRVGLIMGASLCYFWNACGHLRDGRYWLDWALRADDEPTAERAKALWVNGWDAMTQGDNDTAQSYFAECVDLARQLDDPVANAFAMQFSGTSHQFIGNLDEAISLLEDAVAEHRRLGTLNSLSVLGTAELGFAYVLTGHLDRAISLCEEAIRLCETHGERWTLSWALWVLGLAQWTRHEFEEASTTLQRALDIKWSLNDRLGVSCCIDLLAWTATEQRDPHRAACLFGVGQAMWEAIGQELFGSARLIETHAAYEERVRDELGETTFAEECKRGTELDPEAAVGYALNKDARSRRAVAASESSRQPALTRREQEVAKLVAKGLSNQEIADRLVISRRTAEGHVEHVLVKLGVTSRTHVALWAAAHEAPLDHALPAGPG